MLKLIFKYSLLCAVLWTLIIFGLCCMPGQYIPTTNWLELLSFDKFVHASIFFGLTCLWLVYLHKIKKINNTSIAVTLLICIFYGGMLEVMQATVFSHRSADWLDFIANSFGCLVGFFVFAKKRSILLQFNN